jgi:glucokinase
MSSRAEEERMAEAVLVLDVGGTNVRALLAEANEGRAGAVLQARFVSSGWARLQADLKAFLRDGRAALADRVEIQAAVLAVAGVVEENGRLASVTRWQDDNWADVALLMASLGVPRALAMNDLQAACIAAAREPEANFTRVGAGSVPLDLGRFILLMPGTGLGMGVYLEGAGSVASEGGNALCAFDWRDQDEIAAAEAFRKRRPEMPSYEEAASAEALAVLARCFSGQTLWPEEVAVGAGEGRFAKEMALYAKFLARAAQGAALTVLPGACLLAGSIAASLPKEAWPLFAKEFRNHPVHGALLARIGLWLCEEEDLPLRGALLRAIELVGGEVTSKGHISPPSHQG